MIFQTVEALAEAIDVKDRYMNGIPNAIINIIIMNEFIKGAVTQFDPIFAKIMIKLIDADTGYQMRET